MGKRGLFLVLLLLLPVVFAAQPPAPPLPVTPIIEDCRIQTAVCVAPLEIFGYVSSQGHFTRDPSTGFTYYFCCRNLANNGTGAVSFRYALDSNQGQVSVNSSLTIFQGQVRMGFPDACSVKDSCNLASGEVCLFKVCYGSPSCRLDDTNPYSIDNSHIADCNTANVPFVNSFTKEVCCKFNEICNDGIDNDGDGYIDCADEDCKQTFTNSPKLCTNSPYTSDECIVSMSTVSGVTSVTYNQSCVGQQPLPLFNTYPVVYPPVYVMDDSWKPPVWYCSYGEAQDSSQNTPGVCCQAGTYAKQNPFTGVWECIGSEACGIGTEDSCKYDIDASFNDWLGSYYAGNADNWCNSKFPNYYSLGIPYSPRSTGCCLIAQNAEVGYYTAEANVKIFGYHKYCGDGIIDFDEGEECDGNYLGTCADYIDNCPLGTVPTGTPLCNSQCQLQVSGSNCYCAPATNNNNNNNED